MSDNQDKPPGEKKRIKKWLLRLLIGCACLFVLGCLVVGGILLYYNQLLPPFDSLADYNPPQVTRMYDREGRIVAELYHEKRTVVDFAAIPVHVRNAFLAAEDAEFYDHPGLDFPGMLRALWQNLKAGRVVQGGSTITQQVIKTFILGPERSYARKIKEVLLALRLESNLSKDEILGLYLNQIFFGHHCYGIQEASRFYFNKDVSALSVEEGAMLASLPKSPAGYSPLKHPDRARKRRNWVIDQMFENDMIDGDECRRAKNRPLEIAAKSSNFFKTAPYYAEHCRRVLEDKLGKKKLYEGGLRIDLALDLDLQLIARRAMARGLRRVDQRQGFRGPLAKLSDEELLGLQAEKQCSDEADRVWTLRPPEPGHKGKDVQERHIGVEWREGDDDLLLIVPVMQEHEDTDNGDLVVDLGCRTARIVPSSIKWARKFSPLRRTPAPKSLSDLLEPGDVIEVRIEKKEDGNYLAHMSQPPLVQGSLVAMESDTKNVLAMLGGSDFRRSPLIRAVQSRRQPGSSFKPIVYAAAIHTGAYTPATILMDTPEVYHNALHGSAWKPQNFERVFSGPVTLRHALAHSINTVAVKVGADVGPAAIIEMARKLGIESDLKPNLSLALGASEVTLLELSNAYSVFAGRGLGRKPVFITSVKGPNGEDLDLVEQAEPAQVISEAEAFVLVSLLCSVIREGTGRKALSINRPLGGKTGTTNGQRDGWFIGFSPDLTTGVWVGFDDHSRMGYSWAQGAGTALPIWLDFMKEALQDRPRMDFKASPGTVFVKIDPENGLLAPAGLLDAKFEVYVEGTEPRSVSCRTGKGVKPLDGETETKDANSGRRLPEGLFH